MTTALLKQWEKANISFSPPITISEKGVQSRLKRAWETVQKIVWKRKIKEDNVREFESKLDKLVDITKCKCEIKSCDSFGCNGYELGAHIQCSCLKELKLPVLELLFLKTQREKTGDKGAMKISDTVDREEQKKHEKTVKRREVCEKRIIMKQEKEKRLKLDLEERDQQVEEENLEESVEEKEIEDDQDTSSLLKKTKHDISEYLS